RIQRIVVAIEPHIGVRRRCRESSGVAAAHRRDGVGGADQRRQRDVGGMGVANRFILDRAQAEALRGVVGRLLEPAVVEHQRFGLTIFEEQLAVVGAGKPARDFMADLVAVEMGAVEERGGGVHGVVPLWEARMQDSCSTAVPRGAESSPLLKNGRNAGRYCPDCGKLYRWI